MLFTCHSWVHHGLVGQPVHKVPQRMIERIQRRRVAQNHAQRKALQPRYRAV